jgi:hypothetical protein
MRSIKKLNLKEMQFLHVFLTEFRKTLYIFMFQNHF